MIKCINKNTKKIILILVLIAVFAATYATYTAYAWYVVSVNDSTPVSKQATAGAIDGSYTVDYSVIGIPGEGMNDRAPTGYEWKNYSYVKAEITINNDGTSSPEYGAFVYNVELNNDFTTLVKPGTVITIDGKDVGEFIAPNGIYIYDDSTKNYIAINAINSNEIYGYLDVGDSSGSIEIYIPLIKFYGETFDDISLLTSAQPLTDVYDGNETQSCFTNEQLEDAINNFLDNNNSAITVKWCQYDSDAVTAIFPDADLSQLGLS